MFAIVAALPVATRAEDNLLKHTEFKMKGEEVVGWDDRSMTKQKVSVDSEAGHAAARTALRVDIDKDGSTHHGAILQNVRVKPETTYRISGDIKAGSKRMAYIQIKQWTGRKQEERITTGNNEKEGQWESLSEQFTTGKETTLLQVHCRFRMSQEHIGKAAWFANLSLVEVTGDAQKPDAAPDADKPAADGTDEPAAPAVAQSSQGLGHQGQQTR
ncbi:MAG: carbohydrate binding domain-containing protein [Phycisphaeraceae bacterium]